MNLLSPHLCPYGLKPIRVKVSVILTLMPFPSFAWKGLSVGLYHLKIMISKPVSGLLSPHLDKGRHKFIPWKGINLDIGLTVFSKVR